MKDETEGPKLIRAEGSYYLSELKELAELGVRQATERSKNHRVYSVTSYDGQKFTICSSDHLLPAAYLFVEINEPRTLVTRTLQRASKRLEETLGVEDPPMSKLDPIELRTDPSGNPTAYLDGKFLPESEIINAFVSPVTEGADDF